MTGYYNDIPKLALSDLTRVLFLIYAKYFDLYELFFYKFYILLLILYFESSLTVTYFIWTVFDCSIIGLNISWIVRTMLTILFICMPYFWAALW